MKPSRFDGPFGGRNVCLVTPGRTRRERKWLARQRRVVARYAKRRLGRHTRWMQRGYASREQGDPEPSWWL